MRSEKYFIIGLLLLAVMGLSFVVSPIYAAVLIPASAFGVILMGNPRFFLFFYLLFMGINPLLQATVTVGPVKYLNELMGAILFTLLLGHFAMRKLDMKSLKGMSSLLFVFCCYVAVIWLANRSSAKGGVQFFMTYLPFIPIYILSVNFLKRSDLKLILLGSIGFFWVNFALNVGWLIGINPIPNRAYQFLAEFGYGSGNFDASIGTFNSQTIMAYFCAMFLFILFSVKLEAGHLFTKRMNRLVSVTIVAVFIQFYLTYTNHAYLYFAAAFVLFAAVSGLWRRWQGVMAVTAFLLILILSFSVSEQLRLHFSKENMTYRVDRLIYSAKIQLFHDLIVKNYHDNKVEWFFGVGPGNGMGSIGKKNLSPFALKMLLPYYQSYDMQAMQMTSITGNTISAVFSIWGDLGLFGLFLLLLIYIKFIIQCIKSSRDNHKTKMLSRGLIGTFTFFLIANITFDLFIISFLACWVSMFMAMVVILQKDESEESKTTDGVRPDSRQPERINMGLNIPF